MSEDCAAIIVGSAPAGGIGTLLATLAALACASTGSTCALGCALLLCVLPLPASAQQYQLRVVSSRPDMVSGGNVLAWLRAPNETKWIVRLNGRSVTSSFRSAKDSHEFVALLTGLKAGKNVIEVRSGMTSEARLEVVNHRGAGPIFSGSRHGPLICETEVNGLGRPRTRDCDARPRVEYYYRSSSAAHAIGSTHNGLNSLERLSQRVPPGLPPGFKPYDLNNPPDDVAPTVTTDGHVVPYIVRRELGATDRVIYDIRFLHQPGKPLPTPWTGPGSAWNGRLVFVLQVSGCAVGGHEDVLYRAESDEALLSMGYAVAASTHPVFSGNCNPVTSAEVVAAVKEHFIKNYGEPIHAIGWGNSNAAMEQYFIAQNYPGLLDGIIPSLSFPDTLSFLSSVNDCRLLQRAFSISRTPWTEEQKAAVAGFAKWETCQAELDVPIKPDNCPPEISRTKIYNAASRRRGIRCDFGANEINLLGRDSKTRFGARPFDNVGVEYGLAAFNANTIDAERFVELNESIGGLDADGGYSDTRTAADLDTIRRAYRAGLVLTGGAGLPTIPIIDWRNYGDDAGDVHVSFESFAIRERLMSVSGAASNQVILIYPNDPKYVFVSADPSISLIAKRAQELVPLMDHWLDAVRADNNAGSLAAKVARDRPASIADACWTKNGERIAGPNIYLSMGRCIQMYPMHGDPRIAAGAPLADDILKCQLKPLTPTDYSRSVSEYVLRRLKTIFPQGVCDFSRPGIGQQLTVSTWQRF